MGIVTRELRVRSSMLAVKTSWSRFGRPAGLYSDIEDRYGIHGGDFETSVMLHFRPDLVDMSKAEDFASSVAARRAGIRAAAPTGHARLRLDRLRPQSAWRGRRGFEGDGRKGPADRRAPGGRIHHAAEGCQEGEARRLAAVAAERLSAPISSAKRHALEGVGAAADRLDGLDHAPLPAEHVVGERNQPDVRRRRRRNAAQASAPVRASSRYGASAAAMM